MSKIDEIISNIKDQKIGSTGKRVLMVEGTDDVDALSIFLSKKFPDWEKTWIVEPAGNKKQVLGVLLKEANWLGFVDKDEWSSTEITAKQTAHTNLVISPRFCMESYLVDPNELWSAFPQKQRDKITGGLPDLINTLSATKGNWLRHAALWHVINPLWGRLRGLGFKEGVLDAGNVPDDATLTTKLQAWHDAIDAGDVMRDVQALILHLQGTSDAEFYAQWLYAKDFYPTIVQQALNRLLGSMNSKTRRIEIIRHLPVPPDLDPLWHKMGLM